MAIAKIRSKQLLHIHFVPASVPSRIIILAFFSLSPDPEGYINLFAFCLFSSFSNNNCHFINANVVRCQIEWHFNSLNFSKISTKLSQLKTDLKVDKSS